MSLDSFRRHFRQTTERGIFFDNASMGPVAPQVTRAMTACMELRQAMPMKYYRYAQELFPQCRTRLARMIGGTAEEIAFTENVTYGINSAALSLPLSPGDNVLLCDREFGSNVYPWLRLQKEKGVEARIVPNDGGGLTLPLLERYADRRTRAVAVSSVEFSDGFAADLEAIGSWCSARGVYLVVDCAQSLGVMPMDVRRFRIDFLAGLSSKWLLGPFSTGFLYVRRELAGELVPPFVGADSVKGDVDALDYALELKDGAARFEGGLPNAPGIAGLNASLALMEETGLDQIHREAWRVSGLWIDALRELGAELAPCALSDRTRSTIVSFKTPDVPAAYQALREGGVACSVRGGYVRTGIHAFNTDQEVERAAEVLRRHLRG